MSSTSPAQTSSQTNKSSTGGHTPLPPWFERFQDTVVLSFLIIAGAILTGLMYVEGLVPNVEDPRTWGILGGIKFAGFFVAGFGVAGVALRASSEMSKSFRRGGFGGYFWGLVFLLVSVMFAAIEIWANITERSKTHTFTPADQWVLQAIGYPNMPVSPTVIAIAVAQSLVLLVWGLVVGKRDVESAEDRQARFERERAEAEHQAALTEIKNKTRGTGVGSFIVGGIKTVQSGLSSSDRSDYEGEHRSGYEGDDSGPYSENDRSTYAASRDESRSGATSIVELPKRGSWNRSNLISYARQKYQIEIDPDDATDAMRTLSNGEKSGKHYVASAQVVRRWVDGYARKKQVAAS